MRQSTKDTARGAIHEVKGSTKRFVTIHGQSLLKSYCRKDRWEGTEENRPSGEGLKK